MAQKPTGMNNQMDRLIGVRGVRAATRTPAAPVSRQNVIQRLWQRAKSYF